MNRHQFDDRATWRLPTINELESLVDCGQHAPALPQEHPFEAVQPIYWSVYMNLVGLGRCICSLVPAGWGRRKIRILLFGL
ncbi:MAG: DUF1566 domain-containing protein [Pseudomonadota bacterium]|nr:DUF1566 domain-containing protein [Pseudomonadota bacterium]